MRNVTLGIAAIAFSCATAAQTPAETPASRYDADLATKLGGDDYGMRKYVLVILKTGTNKVAAGPEHDAMMKGHFSNMKRLADEGKLVLAGPLDGVDGWQGMFVFNAADIEEAKKLTATDPAIAAGAMVAEYHRYFASAALMQVKSVHEKIAKKQF